LIKFYAIFKIAELQRYEEFRGFPFKAKGSIMVKIFLTTLRHSSDLDTTVEVDGRCLTTTI
jgi:hypothetical protein